MRPNLLLGGMLGALFAGLATPAFADPTIFNSIPFPLLPNVASEGPEA